MDEDRSALVTDLGGGGSADSARDAEQEARARARRRYRVEAFAGSVGIGLGLSVVVTSSFVADLLGLRSPLLMLFGIGIVGASTASVLSLYLRGKLSVTANASAPVSALDAEARLELMSALEKVKTAATRLSENYSSEGPSLETETDNRLLASRAVLREARKRLSDKAVSLERRARVNLVIGSSTSVAAVVMLIAFAFSPVHMTELSWQQLLSLYLPKFGVVVMLEVFAFFFLRLYKATLVDSRLLDKDFDALALKEAALVAAWSQEAQIRLDFAKCVIAPGPAIAVNSEESQEPLDPKSIAELASAISKLMRG